MKKGFPLSRLVGAKEIKHTELNLKSKELGHTIWGLIVVQYRIGVGTIISNFFIA